MHARARSLAFALAVAVLLSGAAVHAAPAKVASRHGKQPVKRRAVVVAPAADEDTVITDDDVDPPAEAPRVAIDSREDGGDVEEVAKADAEAEAVVTAAPAPRWHVAIGPYLWASSVDARVSLGPASAGGDGAPLERHGSYGAEVLAEARYGRLSVSGDLMYGTVVVNGAAGIGPVMTMVTGNASSLLIDGVAGYAVLGDDRSVFALEVRGGARYQRTAVHGEVGLAGFTLRTPESVAAGSDAVVGARGFVRPCSWLSLSGALDGGVFGASNRTWSASADLSVHATSYLLVSLGWRTLTLDRTQVSLVMQGPRAAVQLTF